MPQGLLKVKIIFNNEEGGYLMWKKIVKLKLKMHFNFNCRQAFANLSFHPAGEIFGLTWVRLQDDMQESGSELCR